VQGADTAAKNEQKEENFHGHSMLEYLT
jgi:hypothetical protein